MPLQVSTRRRRAQRDRQWKKLVAQPTLGGPVKYISLFSGIEAVTCAWHPLGFEPLAFAETTPFPSAVLAHHYPNVPNLGDVTAADWSPYEGRADVVTFGSPCQSFSIAGKRLGLDDPRGNLALFALRVVARVRPRWFLFENVPGLLSSGGGRDFGTFLAAVGECGYQGTWRILDAQYFGVPQRRRRLFVVGHLGDWRRAAAVLFERESLLRNPPPRREEGARIASAVGAQSAGRGWRTEADEAAGGQVVASQERACDAHVADALTSEGPGAVLAFSSKDYGGDVGDVAPTLRASGFTKSHANGGAPPAVIPTLSGVAPTLERMGQAGVIGAGGVRRLLPSECEALQGFPRGYTAITYKGKPAADGPRYEAIGNSMAVPVIAWIGRRILAVGGITPPPAQEIAE